MGIDCTAFTDPCLERTIQGIKLDHNEPELRTQSPLTCPYLVRILNILPISNYEDIVLDVAFTLAFAGFLLVGEFTYRATDLELGATFSNWFLTKSSIRLIARWEHIELTLPATKTDPFRKEIKLIITASKDEGCLVQAMKSLIEIVTHRPRLPPLFYVGKYE